MAQSIFKRAEVKYLLRPDPYKQLIKRTQDLFQPDAYGKTDILNLYYDTPDFLLIRKSLEQPVYKEKLRLRSYGTATSGSASFIELKKKYKGIVYKRRIELPYAQAVSRLTYGQKPEEASQIGNEIEYFRRFYPNLEPRMMISYERIACVGTEDPDLRVTFDRNIRWRTNRLDLRCGPDGEDLLPDGCCLMEIKIAGGMDPRLSAILSELSIFKTSFSKYGRGYLNYIRRAPQSICRMQTLQMEQERSHA